MDVSGFTNLEEAGRVAPVAAAQDSTDAEAAQAFSEAVEIDEFFDELGEGAAAVADQADPLMALIERWSGVTAAVAEDDGGAVATGRAAGDSVVPVAADAGLPEAEGDTAMPGAARIAGGQDIAVRTESPVAPKPASDPGAVIAQLPQGVLIQREGGVEFVASATPAARVVLHDPGAVIRQVTDAMVIQRDGQVEVTLAPEELGRVRLLMSGREHGLHVVVMAERPEVLDMLRRHAPALLEQFADTGAGDAALEFRQDDGGGDGRQDQAAPEPAMIATLPAATETGTWTAAPGRLDIRL